MELVKRNSLSPDESWELAQQLDRLSSEVQIFQQNLTKMGWTRELRPYLTFQQRIKALKAASIQATHMLAERILELGHEPSLISGNYIIKSDLQILPSIENFDHALLTIVDDSQKLMDIVKEVFEIAAEYHEEQTMAFMSQVAKQLALTIHFFMQMRSAHMN